MTATRARRRLWLGAGAVLIAITAVVACDDSEKESPLSAVDYLSLLEDALAGRNALYEGKVVGATTDLEALDGYEDVISFMLDELGRLVPPDELADDHSALVDSIEELAAVVSDSRELLDDDSTGVVPLLESDPIAEALDDRLLALCVIRDYADANELDVDLGCEESDSPQTVQVAIDGFAYAPHELQVELNSTVRWTLGSDPEAHTVTACAGAFDSGLLTAPGDIFQYTFIAAGDFPYSCSIHSEMTGRVVVAQ